MSMLSTVLPTGYTRVSELAKNLTDEERSRKGYPLRGQLKTAQHIYSNGTMFVYYRKYPAERGLRPTLGPEHASWRDADRAGRALNDIRVHRAKRRSSATAPACLSAHKPPVGDKRKACADDISVATGALKKCRTDDVQHPAASSSACARPQVQHPHGSAGRSALLNSQQAQHRSAATAPLQSPVLAGGQGSDPFHSGSRWSARTAGASTFTFTAVPQHKQSAGAVAPPLQVTQEEGEQQQIPTIKPVPARLPESAALVPRLLPLQATPNTLLPAAPQQQQQQQEMKPAVKPATALCRQEQRPEVVHVSLPKPQQPKQGKPAAAAYGQQQHTSLQQQQLQHRAASATALAHQGNQMTMPAPPPKNTSSKAGLPPRKASAAAAPPGVFVKQVTQLQPAQHGAFKLLASRAANKQLNQAPHRKQQAVAHAHPAAADAALPCRMTIEMLHPSDGCRPTGQHVGLSIKRKLGSGGNGLVFEVEVSRAALAAVKQQSRALQALLKHSPESSGTAQPHSSSSSMQGASLGALGGAAAPAAVASTSSATASQATAANTTHHSSSVSSSPMLHMALKVTLPLARLPKRQQKKWQSEDYYFEVLQQCTKEYDVMSACFGCSGVLECYGLASISFEGCRQPCVLLQLSQLGDAEQAYMAKGSTGLSDIATQRVVRQVAVAVHSVHQKARSIHRDLKPSNLLLFANPANPDTPTVKLCDFGVSRQVADPEDFGHTTVGTFGWAAPEQADSRKGQDMRLDSWALGLLVLAFRKAKQPFWWLYSRGVSASMRAEWLTGATLDMPTCVYNKNDLQGSALGPVEKDFVKQCLQQNATDRCPVTSLLNVHPYLSSAYPGG